MPIYSHLSYLNKRIVLYSEGALRGEFEVPYPGSPGADAFRDVVDSIKADAKHPISNGWARHLTWRRNDLIAERKGIA